MLKKTSTIARGLTCRVLLGGGLLLALLAGCNTLDEQQRRCVLGRLVAGGSHHNTNAVGQPQYRQALADLFGLSAASP